MSKYKSNDNDFNQRAAKGQALNLAVSVAASKDLAGDNKYILQQYLRFLHLGKLVQSSSLESLAGALECPEFMEKLKAVQDHLDDEDV